MVLTSFPYFEWMLAFLIIYVFVLLFFLVVAIIKNSNKARFTKLLKEFAMNANIRYIIIFSLPLYWIAFMTLARADWEEDLLGVIFSFI